MSDSNPVQKPVPAPRGVPLPEVEIHFFKLQTSPESLKVQFGTDTRWAEIFVFGELREDRDNLLRELVKLSFKFISSSQHRVVETPHTGPEKGTWRWEVTSAVEPKGLKGKNPCLIEIRFRRYGWKPEGGVNRAKNAVQA
jgi:hypothetical protein